MVRHCVWIFGLIALLVGCSGDRGGGDSYSSGPGGANEALPEAEKFFADWFKSHGHGDVVVDEHGVGVGGSEVRLSASIYGAEQQENGRFVVETEFRVRLAGGREIVEFVAGVGDTKEQAIADTQLNFLLTTFHVVYKAFINDDDPHMTAATMQIGGREREVISGDMYLRSSAAEDETIDLEAMRDKIERALADMRLSQAPHWVKIVYGQSAGAPITVAATTDNEDDPALTERIAGLDWPATEDFYMVKQFFVIR